MGELVQFADFKTLDEWKKFAEKQFITIQFLQEANKKLSDDITKLSQQQIVTQTPVEKIILSPEEALIDDQIAMIQNRAYLKELNLEDVKKLDILLKHKKSFKDEAKILEGKSKKVVLSQAELLKIVQGSSNE